MSTSRVRSIVRTIGAGLALTIIVIVVPILLAVIARWPLPRTLPDTGSMWTRLQQGDIPADSVVKALAVLVWLIWMQLTWTIAWEIVVNLRRVSDRQVPVPAPLVPRHLGAGMARLVAMVFSATVVIASLPSPTLAAPGPPSAVATTSIASRAAINDAPPAAAEIAATCWHVHPDDTLWRIAETALGDGARSDEILDLNSSVTSPRDIKSGQRLHLPSDATVPADRQAAPPDAPPVHAEAAFLAETTITIEAGDTLWDLSTDRLIIADPEGAAASEIVQYVERVVERNPDVVEDPNLIFPGEVFVMPSIGTLRPPEPLPPLPPPEPEPNVSLEQSSQPVEVVTSTPSPPTVPAPSSTSPTPVPQMAHDASTPPWVNGSATARGSSSADLSAQDAVRAEAPWTVAAGASTVLASGLLLLLRRRRRAASIRGTQRRPPTDAHQTLEAEITRASEMPLLTWARHELAALFADPDLPPLSGVPVAVEISAETGIELLWSNPNPNAPRPWEASDQGWTWRATYDPDIEIPNDRSATPLPGLVCVGLRNDRSLLLNIESFGALDLVGDDEAVFDLARSMVTELSTDPVLADTYVHVTDGLFADLPHTSRLRSIDHGQAIERVAATADEHERLIANGNLVTTLDLRCGDGAIGRELLVVVASDGAKAQAMREAAVADRGVAVLVIGSASVENAHIYVDEDGRAELRPLGLGFDAARLPDEAISPIVELLEADVDVSVGGDPWADVSEMQDDRAPVVDQPDSVGMEEGSVIERPRPPFVLVSVLGTPSIPSFPKLGRLDLNLVAFLATNGGSATDDQVINAVWNGRLVEQGTVWNRISKVRSALGQLLPSRESGAERITLAADVRTDLDYFADLVNYADDGSSEEAIELLSEALDLIQGPPFDAPGYDWAHQSQHHTRACDLIETTAVRLVDLVLDTGDIEAGRRGVSLASIALPANEPLYRARMRLEAAAGNPGGVVSAFDELVSVLAEMSDDGFEYEPSARTIRLRDELLAPASVRSA